MSYSGLGLLLHALQSCLSRIRIKYEIQAIGPSIVRRNFGVDLLNEPSAGYIGWENLEVPGAPVEVGLMPSPLESMALGMGRTLEVNKISIATVVQ